MNATVFREELRARLLENADRVILRILVSRTQKEPVELTGSQLLERSLALAEQYCQAPPMGVVLLLLPHSLELFLLHFGLILTGRLPAILAWPTNRIDPEKYQRNILHQLRNLPAAQVLTLPQLARNLDAGLPYRVTGCPIPDAEYLEKGFAIELRVDPVAKHYRDAAAEDTPPDAIFLQFSGGTTGAQKCVVVTSEILEAQLRRLTACLAFTPEDGVASWLPLYHDMGLIACLWFPLWNNAPSVHCSASDWLMEPSLLFALAERYTSTFCWLPNFAFSYLAGQRERMERTFSIGHVRAWINCSEPVRQRSMNNFTETFTAWGVRPEQCQASYAMAENVFAVTQTPLGDLPRTVPRSRVKHRSVDFSQLAYDLLDDVYVASGTALDGMSIRIRHADGDLCAEYEPGGIEILTESLFSGYWGNGGFQKQALTADGWYLTGDYGFLSDGHLYVIGRTKDIVIVGGQNIFPEDAEMVANSVEGVYPGRVVAFGVENEQQGTESLAVIAEMRGVFERGQAQRMEREIQKLVFSTIGIAPRYVRVVPERWIVKSTAGKISRKETRMRFLEEQAGLRHT